MAKSPNWTDEEKDLLTRSYPTLGKCEELQRLFPTRPLTGICLKANRMGLKVLNDIRKGRTHEEYVALLTNTNFEVLETYRGSTELILHRCKRCNTEWYTRPQHALRINAKCPECTSHNKNSIEKVDKVLDEAGFIRLSEYTGALDKITLKHKHCGYEWDTVYSYIQQGSGCPVCNEGFGYIYKKDNMPEKAHIYLLKITLNTDVFLKVGVTAQNGINLRVNSLRKDLNKYGTVQIDIIKDLVMPGTQVLLKEKEILSKYNKYKSNIDFSGKTELLDISDLPNILKEFEVV